MASSDYIIGGKSLIMVALGAGAEGSTDWSGNN